MAVLGERDLWLAVSQVPGIGPRAFYQILDIFGTMTEFWHRPSAEIKTLMSILREQQLQELLAARERFDLYKMMDEIKQANVKLVTLLDDHYPARLKTIFDPPPVLFYRGNLAEEKILPAVAIVGARKATPYGREISSRFASELAQNGVTIVSGLARGVDSAAHRGTLAGNGRTIAVLGCGLDVIYPPENRRLYDEIANKGVLLSEFPLGAPPDSRHFPRRNRIISGLSQAVLVIEAAANSGSLITADFALEQGREVFAVPGPITSRLSFGTNNLIRQGARLVQKASDIIEELGLKAMPIDRGQIAMPELSQTEIKIYECFGESTASIHIDQLVRDSKLTVPEVTAILMMLELKGLIGQLAGKMFYRLPTDL